jgi:predicted HicB family RNase H-like nuclease
MIAEAAREKISVNRLVTRMLEENLAAGALRRKLGWMELPQMLWVDLIKATREDERERIARSRGIEVTKQILINLYGHAAADTFLRFLPELGNFLTPASVEVSTNREDYTILVLHAGAGIGLAKFISAMILASVEYFLHVKAITEYSEMACSIKFKTRLDHSSHLASKLLVSSI